MPDPLQVLPNELWSFCIELAIDGRLNGPLDFLMVSMHWQTVLHNSPSLWTQIYIQNGEDEMARISTFLHLSERSPLHIHVMTVLPAVDGLQLVAEHISRVRTISIRPGPLDNVTALHAKQWKLATSLILATLSNGMLLTDMESPSCVGFTILDGGQPHYHVIFMEFTVAARVASTDGLNHMWEEHIAKIIPAPEEHSSARTVSISSIAELAHYTGFHQAITSTIPLLINLLLYKDWEVLQETVKLVGKLANHVEFHESVANAIPSLVKLVEDGGSKAPWYTAQLIGTLADHVEFREVIANAIPSLVKFVEDGGSESPWYTIQLIGKLANHVEFRELIATAFPILIKLLEDRPHYVRLEIVVVIGKLANHIEFRGVIADAIPSLIKLLEYNDQKVLFETVVIISKLVNHVEFRELIATAFPILIKVLEDGHFQVQQGVVKVIGKMANHVEFREVIATAFPLLIKLLGDGYFQVRQEAAKVLGDMKSSGTFQPSLFELAYRKVRLDNGGGSQREHQADQG